MSPIFNLQEHTASALCFRKVSKLRPQQGYSFVPVELPACLTHHLFLALPDPFPFDSWTAHPWETCLATQPVRPFPFPAQLGSRQCARLDAEGVDPPPPTHSAEWAI